MSTAARPITRPGSQTVSSAQTPALQVRPAATALQPAPAVLVTAPAALAGSPEISKRQTKTRHSRRRHLSRRAMLFRGAAITFVLVLTAGGLLAWNGYMKLHKVFHGNSVVAALAPQPAKTGTLDGTANGRINILLLGVSGGDGTAADLTDTVALLSIDPVNHKAALVNIPTDLWVQKPTSLYGHQELNHVYKDGRDTALGPNARPEDPGVIEAGFSSLDQTVENVTGVSVDYHMLLNFQAFKQAVDAVGGITINSPAKLTDYSLGWRNHVSPVLATQGTQHMDGEQALLYARSRILTSKSSQMQRELQVLTAVEDKAFSAGTYGDPAKLEGLIEGFGDNAFSDLSIKGAGQLYALMHKIDDSDVQSVSLIGKGLDLLTTKHEGHLAVAVPSAGQDRYADIQQYVRGFAANGNIVKEAAPVAVLSGTAAGAEVAGNMLKSYGCDVTATAATKQHVSDLTLVDLSGGDDPATLHFLENHYGVKAVYNLPAGASVPTGSAKFVIIEP